MMRSRRYTLSVEIHVINAAIPNRADRFKQKFPVWAWKMRALFHRILINKEAADVARE